MPSFTEDSVSQLPALRLLVALGWQYLSPDAALAARGGRSAAVLLEAVLRAQLRRINRIEYRGRDFEFSDANIQSAVLALRDLPVHEGYRAAGKAAYELLTLGKSLEQTVLGDRKSFSLRYVDWERPENNVWHVTEEFAVQRSGRTDHYRPDLALFLNGIPIAVVECKSPGLDHPKSPAQLAIEQHLRNQQADGIRELYQYAQLLFALAGHEARYATTDTPREFWSVWKEQFRTREAESDWLAALTKLKNDPLPSEARAALLLNRSRHAEREWLELEQTEQTLTGQDRLLYNLCQPRRLLDLIRDFIVFDADEKKVARYQQFFAIQHTLGKVTRLTDDGRRPGGVIWHTQGSGKSLTMVMLAQLLTQRVRQPKIVLVTDRIDLDDQILETFQKCDLPVVQANTGRHLAELLRSPDSAVITTLVHKFEAAVAQEKQGFPSADIFVLVDEGHRSHYGPMHVKMRQVFPRACFIAFTGTPLMKKEKSTANSFGGLIDVYSIADAVADGAVVPLLYEGRHVDLHVNERPLDTYFDKVAEPLSEYGKAELKRRRSRLNAVNQADQVIEARAWDIAEHFAARVKNVWFGDKKAKGQLVAPSKTAAIRYREYLRATGKVTCEVLISPPDVRENVEDAFEETDDVVLRFWKAMMDKYRTPEHYEKTLINAFKKQDDPEIIIVVDKLLTGFDAPNNYVLYLTRPLKDHSLLQAIARVNRVAEGKEHGLIIDYFGNFVHLDQALARYAIVGAEGEFEPEDMADTVIDIRQELEKLPQLHSELWDFFKTVRNKNDLAALEEALRDEAVRRDFYEKVSRFARLLNLALSTLDFVERTPQSQQDRYRHDAAFFLKLRSSVRRRYFDAVDDYREYESQVQKLVDKHLTTEGEMYRLTDMIDIFDQSQRETELDKIKGEAARADHIAARTLRALNVKMDEDPVFHRKLSILIQQTIEDYRLRRLGEAEYLAKMRTIEDQFFHKKRDDVPEALAGNDVAIAIYHSAREIFKAQLPPQPDVAAEIATDTDEAVRSLVYQQGQMRVDWQLNPDLEGKIRLAIDDCLFDLKTRYNLDFPLELIDDLADEILRIAKAKFRS